MLNRDGHLLYHHDCRRCFAICYRNANFWFHLGVIAKRSFAMKFFFDESGDFRVPDDQQQHAVGIVVGVVVPETQEAPLWKRFREFIARLPLSAFKNDEPKGHLLDEEARRAFAVLVSELEGILICPTMLDLTSMAGHALELRDKVIKKLETTAALCEHESMQGEVSLLGRQFGNLSPEVAFRLGSWAQCIKRCIDDSVFSHSCPQFHDCWAKMTFEMDPVQPNAGSREQQVFTKMLPGWVTAWCKKQPIVLIEEVHTENHPFVREWETEGGIDLGKMFRGNLQFRSSNESLGLQIADMAASVARKAVLGIVSAYDLMSYGVMMSKSPRSATHAHGIFSFSEFDEAEIARRFLGLVDAVSVVRKGS
jgi:hypothetical protein